LDGGIIGQSGVETDGFCHIFFYIVRAAQTFAGMCEIDVGYGFLRKKSGHLLIDRERLCRAPVLFQKAAEPIVAAHEAGIAQENIVRDPHLFFQGPELQDDQGFLDPTVKIIRPDRQGFIERPQRLHGLIGLEERGRERDKIKSIPGRKVRGFLKSLDRLGHLSKVLKGYPQMFLCFR